MRAYRKTSITFGLVSVLVGAYKPVESHDVKFKQHHAGCGGQIGMVRVCKECEQEVPWADIAKGTESLDGTLVIADPEEIKSLEGEKVLAIEVVQFIDAGEIDPLSYESAYYLAPDKTSLEGYGLIKHVLEESGRVALVKLAFGRESLGILRPAGKTLVVHTIAWPDEIREPAFAILDKPIKLKPKMVEMAKVLVDSMTEPFDPADHVDTYTERVREFVEAKAAGEPFEAHPAGPEPAVDDLLAALEATIAKRKGKAA